MNRPTVSHRHQTPLQRFWAKSFQALLLIAVALFWLQTSAAAPDTPSLETLTDDLASLERQLRVVVSDLPRDSFDPLSIIEQVGEAPEALADWVMTHTGYVPYQGLLRGSFGVLQDRIGNHADRAFTLAALIEATGREARLEIQRPVTDDQPLSSTEKRSEPSPVTLSDSAMEVLDMVQPGSAAAWQASLAPSKRSRFEEDTQARAAAVISQWTQQPEFPSWSSHSESPESDARVRVWWPTDDNQWSSVDLAEADTMQQRRVPPRALEREAFESRYGHRLQLRIVAERWHNDRYQTVTVLEHETSIPALAMRPIKIGMLPVDLETEEFYGADFESALTKKLLDNDQWMPYLRYYADTVLGDIIKNDGTIVDPTEPATSARMRDAVGALGGISIGGRDRGPRGANAFIGLSLELEHRWNRATLSTVSRPWFRWATADQRPFEPTESQRLERAIALHRDSQLIVQNAQPAEALVTGRILSAMLRNQQGLEGMLLGLADENLELLEAGINASEDYPAAILRFARQRFTASLHPGHLHVAEPNLLFEHTGLLHNGDEFRSFRAIDLAHVPLATHRATQQPSAALIRFEQGVIETVLEAELLALASPPPEAGQDLFTSNAAWTSELEMSAGQSGRWLGKADLDWIDEQDFPLITRQAMALQLQEGRLLYLPWQHPDELLGPSWWKVDPVSGQALGYGHMGWGTSLTEQINLLAVKIYLLKTSLAPAVAKSTLGTYLVCSTAIASFLIAFYTSPFFQGEVPWALDQLGNNSETVINFCKSVLEQRVR